MREDAPTAPVPAEAGRVLIHTGEKGERSVGQRSARLERMFECFHPVGGTLAHVVARVAHPCASRQYLCCSKVVLCALE